MSAISGNYDDDIKEALRRQIADPSRATLATIDPSQASAIRRTQALLGHLITPTPSVSDASSLIGRVGDPSRSLELEAPKMLSPDEQLLEMNSEDLRAIDTELADLKMNPPDPYYYNRLQEVVGKMLALHIRMAEKERISKDNQKTKYTKANKDWGEYQKETGDRGFKFTWIALGLMAMQFIAPEGDRQFISYLSKEGCTNLSNMLNTDTQSKQKMAEGISQIAMAEINAMMNKGSSDASSKQEILSLLEKASEAQRRAAQSS